MISRAIRWAWLFFATALIALAILMLQVKRDAARRASALAISRGRTLELRQLEDEQRRLKASRLSAAEMEVLRHEHAEAEALRHRLAVLEPRLNEPAESGHESDYGHIRLPVEAWIYAGRDTAKATLESVVWSALHGDVDHLAKLLAFSPEVRARADAIFAQLPAASQQQYGSPQKVIATLLAGSFPENASAMTTLGDSESGDNAALSLRVDRSDGQAKIGLYQLQHTAEGWQLLVPANVMKNYENSLAGLP